MGRPPSMFSHEYQNKGVKGYPSRMNIKGKEIAESNVESRQLKVERKSGNGVLRRASSAARDDGDQDGSVGRGHDSVVKEQQR